MGLIGDETLDRRLANYRRALGGQSLPAAWVDLDLLELNIQEMVARAGGKKLRLGTKSIRSKAILDFIIARLPEYGGLMTMTAKETLWLSQKGFDDLVIGYPIVNPVEIEEIAKAIKAGKKITLMADLSEHLDRFEAAAKKIGTVIPVCLDLDASTPVPGIYFGVHRSSLTDTDKLQTLMLDRSRWPNLKFEGLMSYEAQVAGVQDSPPDWWTAPVIRWLKKRAIREVARRRQRALNLFMELGIELRFVNGGGTGSMKSTSQDLVVTEMTVGSGFYSPALFDHYSDFKFEPAAGFALEVTRHSHEKIWTCAGGGYLASGTGPDRSPVPYLPRGLKLLAHEGTGEVQTPVESTMPLALGDLVFFRHAKAGELSERFNSLFLIRGDRISEVVPTYRGEGQSFL